MIGKDINEENAEKAAELALKDAIPMEKNKYKVVQLKAILKNAILRMK